MPAALKQPAATPKSFGTTPRLIPSNPTLANNRRRIERKQPLRTSRSGRKTSIAQPRDRPTPRIDIAKRLTKTTGRLGRHQENPPRPGVTGLPGRGIPREGTHAGCRGRETKPPRRRCTGWIGGAPRFEKKAQSPQRGACRRAAACDRNGRLAFLATAPREVSAHRRDRQDRGNRCSRGRQLR